MFSHAPVIRLTPALRRVQTVSGSADKPTGAAAWVYTGLAAAKFMLAAACLLAPSHFLQLVFGTTGAHK